MSQQETIARGSFTIREFCERHGISKAAYYKLPIKPFVVEIAGPRITTEADAEWKLAMTEYSKSEAVVLEKARRTDKARQAAVNAAKSPRHVSKNPPVRKRRTKWDGRVRA